MFIEKLLKTVKFAAIWMLGSMSLKGGSESWETVERGPFSGSGDLQWVGDLSAFEIDSATWPREFDLVGSRSLRSAESAESSTSTVVTDISDEFDASQDFSWSIYVSGNSAEITTGKRIDLILLSDSGDSSKLELPDSINAYKLSLWDPVSGGSPGHAGAALSDSLSLWKVSSSDSAWELIGSYELMSPANLNQGWNFSVNRSATGQWTVAFANGPSGTPVGAPVITAEDNSLTLDGGSHFSGLGVLTTSGDSHDFGFDNFSATPASIPEVAHTGWLLSATIGYFALLRFKRQKKSSI